MATRLYFTLTQAAAISPAFDSGWDYVSEALRRKLADTKGSSSITVGNQIGPWASGQQALDRQYISTRMNAGVIFNNPATTVKGQIMVREYATTDNVASIWYTIKIISEDGNTVRITVRPFEQKAVTEFISNVTHRNAPIMSAGISSIASYTTVLGDRILIEIGYSDSSGTTPEASAKWGENATDLPENETQTTDGAGWLEFSNTITFAGEISSPVSKSNFYNQSVNRSNTY